MPGKMGGVLIGAALAILLAGLVVAGAAPLEIPLGSAPEIDGILEREEWGDATTIDFTANDGAIEIRVYLLHDGEQVYVAFDYVANRNAELIIPEVLIDADNGNTEGWAGDDWWFHVSAQNCEARGTYEDYGRCGLTRPLWRARPNFAPSPNSVAIPAVEIRIPLEMVGISPGALFGLSLTVNAWPSDTRAYWPVGASIENPATWGEAILSETTAARIAFDSNRDGNVEIYVMNSEGSDPTRLTARPGEGLAAAWSPDGSQIAFSTSTDSFVLDLETDELRQLPPGGQMNWSPDGNRIVFVRHVDGDAEIFVMNSDGSDVRQLTHNDCGDFEPVWLPDGERIGWSSDCVGNADIYVMGADGTNLVRLTDSKGHDAYPHWSPDGSRIVFCSDRTGAWEIYVMDADGSNVRQLTHAGSFAGAPRWSPDGTQIVFEADWDGDAEIYVMNADGSNVRQLTDNNAQDRRPSWRP